MSENHLNHGKSRRSIIRSTVYSVSIYSASDSGGEAEKQSFESKRSYTRPELQDSVSSIRSISDHGQARHRFYRPLSNRTWVLTIFLIAFGLCIMLLELAIAAHPYESEVQGVRKRNMVDGSRNVIWARQAGGTPTSSNSTGLSSTPTTATSSIVASSTSSPTRQSQSSESLTVTTSSSSTPSITSGQPQPSDQLTITTASSVTPTNNSAAQVPGTTEPPVSSPVSASQSSVTPGSESTANSEASGQNTNTASGSGTTSVSSAAATATNVTSQFSQATTLGSVFSTLDASQAATTGAAVSAGNVTVADGKASATTTQGAMPTTTSSDHGNNTTLGSFAGSTSDRKVHTFTRFDYFLAMYLPTLVAVVLQSAWLIVFAKCKMMEPFYQLARPGGAPAATTLTADYLSEGLSLNFVKAACNGHWTLLLAGLIQFNLGVLVTLASEAMNIKATAFCKTPVSDHQPCQPVWVINLGVVRAIEVFLVLCLSMVLLMIILTRRRVSGVFSDPSRIATLADLLVHPPLIQELRQLSPVASKSEIEGELAESRYMLGTFETYGHQQCGIIKLENNGAPGSSVETPWYQSSYHKVQARWRSFVDHTTIVPKALPFLPDVLCLLLIFVLFVLVLAYWSLSSGGFSDWMNSGDFGPDMFLTAIAVLVSFLIKRKEQLLRLSHPYVVLSKPPSRPASETITTGPRGTQFASMYSSFRSRDLSLAFMSSAAVLSDLLLIMIPGIPFTPTQTRDVYRASTWSCLLMLALIFVAQARVTYKDCIRKKRATDACPDTLAAGLMRLCASRFVEEKNIEQMHPVYFDNGESISSSRELGEAAEQRQRLKYEGIHGQRRYKFACMGGVDGVSRHMVDEDCS